MWQYNYMTTSNSDPAKVLIRVLRTQKELSVSRRISTRGAAQRKSMIVQTSPILARCQSPSNAGVSPLDSPKVSTAGFWSVGGGERAGGGGKLRSGDGRRWSVASLPSSSGYGTTPGSSAVSSRCSSQERLHQPHHQSQLNHQERLARQHFDSNESNPSLVDIEEGRRSPSFRPRSRSLRLATVSVLLSETSIKSCHQVPNINYPLINLFWFVVHQ